MAIHQSTSLMAPISSPAVMIAPQRSPWHSPVPYLFGALAAMMALIAFALLILACSYWKLSRNLRNEAADGDQRDLEVGSSQDVKPSDNTKINQSVFEENYLVIMAGQHKPTFLATPASSSRTSSFGGSSFRSSSMTSEDNSQMEKDESSNRLQTSTLVSADHEQIS
uniref:protein GLUTAMINE DUMPER 2-like n=1 Tax=Erigeron canadensis TaxID=72917 RepID=UPI001CB8B7D8|nr:protein GLUTAMINE DUMPER 2-like [Erigeron canadensis]